MFKCPARVALPVFRLARGGAAWFLAPLVTAILAAGLASPLRMPWLVPLSTVPFFVALLMLGFFRDPERRPAEGIVSGADGKVVRVDEVDDPDLGRAARLSIFMRPTDVHVNRMPLDADVRRVVHAPGGHVPAFSKDSDRNERVTYLLRTELGDVKLVQIAGAVARRIVAYVHPGDHVPRGGRIGLIRLGSRFDLLVPPGTVEWTVAVGDRVHAGRTQVGRVAAKRPPARGPAEETQDDARTGKAVGAA